MIVHEHFGVSLGKVYTSAKDGEIRLLLRGKQKKSISLNIPETPVAILPIHLKRDRHDGMLHIAFDIYDENGRRLASVKNNMIVPENGQDGYYSIRETDDEITVLQNATSETVFTICTRQGSPSSVGLVMSVRLHLPDGSLVDDGQCDTI